MIGPRQKVEERESNQVNKKENRNKDARRKKGLPVTSKAISEFPTWPTNIMAITWFIIHITWVNVCSDERIGPDKSAFESGFFYNQNHEASSDPDSVCDSQGCLVHLEVMK